VKNQIKKPSTIGRTAAEANSEEQIRIRAYELYEAIGVAVDESV
jgi:hypothetical protein